MTREGQITRYSSLRSYSTLERVRRDPEGGGREDSVALDAG